jgi:hypothetical protein
MDFEKKTFFQELGPRLFDMSSAGGYMCAKHVQEFGQTYELADLVW